MSSQNCIKLETIERSKCTTAGQQKILTTEMASFHSLCGYVQPEADRDLSHLKVTPRSSVGDVVIIPQMCVKYEMEETTVVLEGTEEPVGVMVLKEMSPAAYQEVSYAYVENTTDNDVQVIVAPPPPLPPSPPPLEGPDEEEREEGEEEEMEEEEEDTEHEEAGEKESSLDSPVKKKQRVAVTTKPGPVDLDNSVSKSKGCTSGRTLRSDITEDTFKYKEPENRDYKMYSAIEVRKERERNGEKVVCDLCNHKMPISKLADHIRDTHADGTTPHSCDQCGKGFYSKSKLKYHYVMHSKVKAFACVSCDLTFKRPAELKIHKVIHEKAKDFKCEFCPAQFNVRFALKGHMMKHTGERPYSCKQCTKCYTTSSALRIHEKNAHNERERDSYTCDHCPAKYVSHAYLKKHIDEYHTIYKDAPFVCKVCCKQYRAPSLLKIHVKIHDIPKSYCSFCGKGFIKTSHLQEHIRIHTKEKPYICEECNEAYAHRSALLLHIKRNHQPEVPPEYICEECFKPFYSIGNLKAHMSSHTVRKCYLCEICDKSYGRLSILKKHMEIHSNEIYDCAYCNKRFKTTDAVVAHGGKVHGTKILTGYDIQEAIELSSTAQCEVNLLEDDGEQVMNDESFKSVKILVYKNASNLFICLYVYISSI